MSTYKLKEVLFGLRKEYLSIQQELEQLRKIILENDKRIIEYDAWITYRKDENITTLVSELKMKQSKLKRKSKQLEEKLKYYFIERKNGIYIYPEDFQFKMSRTEQQQYIDMVDRILQLPFTKEFNYRRISKEGSGQLSISHRAMCYCINNDVTKTISYSSKKDILFVSLQKGIMTKPYINQILQTQLQKESFTEYMQESIESSGVIGKRVQIIGDINQLRQTEFSIEEEENKLVLKKNSIKSY